MDCSLHLQLPSISGGDLQYQKPHDIAWRTGNLGCDGDGSNTEVQNEWSVLGVHSSWPQAGSKRGAQPINCNYPFHSGKQEGKPRKSITTCEQIQSLNLERLNESIFTPNDPRFPKYHCFFGGFSGFALCPGNSNMHRKKVCSLCEILRGENRSTWKHTCPPVQAVHYKSRVVLPGTEPRPPR